MSYAREREIARGERERGLGGGAANGRGPQGERRLCLTCLYFMYIGRGGRATP
jgi:hypothetical protein